MASPSVLDVGCGTGALLHMAREAGHTGRLCGLDPAEGMLLQARRRSDIEWVQGFLGSVAWEREFDLAVMTGHAFQAFIHDREIQASLAAIHAALKEGGRFAFETRNPLARGWEAWTPDNALEIVDREGNPVRMSHQVDQPFDVQTVSFTITYSSPTWAQPQLSRSTLRFLDADSLSRFLVQAGFVIEAQFGDWDRSPLAASPLSETSPELISIVRRQA
jgi:ubiquinone/menaquinone biosynthesis C-methylase UbiE